MGNRGADIYTRSPNRSVFKLGVKFRSPASQSIALFIIWYYLKENTGAL